MIWTYKENQEKEVDEGAITGFAPTGDFYEDVKNCCEAAGLLVHPALRKPTWDIEKPEKEK